LRFSFEDFELDRELRELRRAGALVPAEPKVFDLLVHLIEQRERVVSRDELIETVWQGRIVSDSALASAINAARAAVGDSGEAQRLIKTFPRKGIRFVGTLRSADTSAKSAAESPGGNGAALALPDKPSIAVLPFQNISSDPEQDYFADGMVEDIISGLSRIRWLFVIGRNSSFVYKGQATDVKRVGRELGVRYVLEGSVRKAGDRLRLTGQLVEAQSGIQLWSDRYDRMHADIFDLQDELTMSVIGAIEPSLRKVEIERVRRKRPDSLDAYELFLRALPFTYSHTADDARHAMPLLRQALALEPDYAAAHAALAWCHHFYLRFGRGEEDRKAAVEHARAAVASGSDDATALGMAGFVIATDEHDRTTALNVFDRALTLSNSNIFALCCSALVLALLGKHEHAVERAQRALRLSPFDFLNYLAYNALAITYLAAGQHETAYEAAHQSVQINPRFSVCRLFLVAALVQLGRLQEARTQAETVLALDPKFSIGQFQTVVGFDPTVFGVLAAAWKAVGLPETRR
jgi:TolB-like protein/Tfp pilus assembly protein PilF